MIRIAYVTAEIPYGKGESFIYDELLALESKNVELVIIPRSPGRHIFHKQMQHLASHTIRTPLLSLWMLIGALVKLVFGSRLTWKILTTILRNSRGPSILFKNLAVFPKGIFIASLLKSRPVHHIHAHWGATTATIAYVIAQLTGIPWSFTLHRGDIKENNMLKEKARTASFVRCISEHGRKELLEIIGKGFEDKIVVIHMGVSIESAGEPLKKGDRELYRIVTPANLLPVKGHKYLVDACSILLEQGIKHFKCYFYGDGPLREELETYIATKSLKSFIEMPGQIPREKLIEQYMMRQVDIVVLPSITTDNGEHEGIPSSLIEAMACGIPVISTNTGAIAELIGDASGIMVEEKNASALASAIANLMEDVDYRMVIAERGRCKVVRDFNSDSIARALLRLFQANAL